jgi:hypothetical protein
VILASVVVFAVVFAAIVFVTARLFQVSVSRLVLGRHHDLEEILETGDVPRSWREPYEKRLSALEGTSAGSERTDALTAKARRGYLAKLSRLRRYVETTRLVDGDETREVLLDRLAELRNRLQHSPRV